MAGNSGRHVVVVGAGPGGLTSAMLLASRGFKVTVLEKKPVVGGRNAAIEAQGFKFDTGPTFLMMKFILDEIFQEAGRKSEDYLKFTRLDPMYRLIFDDRTINMMDGREKMAAEIGRVFPGEEKSLDNYYREEDIRFNRTLPCLQKDYSTLASMFNKDLIRALPRLALHRKLYGILGDYFKAEKLRLSFTFQAKYLGMSPWQCPAAFALLSYVEHAYGVWHVIGGLSEISVAMAKVVGEHGGEIRLNCGVKRILHEKRRAVGVLLESGEEIRADEVIINSDFGSSMGALFEPGYLRKYSPEKLSRKKLSCSTFMMYLGTNRTWDLPHHVISFARDYRASTEAIFTTKVLTDDISFYVRNASVTDSTLAPAGKSALYILVPVANMNANVDWSREKERYRALVYRGMEERLGMKGVRESVEVERIITPADWQDQYRVYRGATFNLAHNLMQMLYFRPRNRFEEMDNCWLTGGGTHPGSGLPTIYESGRISANMISRKHKIAFKSFNLKV
jgi:phytoene desaturase